MRFLVVVLAVFRCSFLCTSGVLAQFRDEIPDADIYFESVRLGGLAYVISDVELAFSFSAPPFQALYATGLQEGVEAAVVISNVTESIFVAFRGTDGESEDTLSDLDMVKVPLALPNSDRVLGKVHRGFYRRLFETDIWKILRTELKKAVGSYPTYNIVITGHSLGAAESQLFGVYVAAEVYPNRNIRNYAVATPRVGDKDYKKAVEAFDNYQTVRMVYYDDIICRMPLDTQGYYDAGHLLHHIDDDIKLYYQQDGSQDLGYGGVPVDDWLISLRNPVGLLKPAFDHAPWSYEGATASVLLNDKWPTRYEPYVGPTDRCCILFVLCWSCLSNNKVSTRSGDITWSQN